MRRISVQDVVVQTVVTLVNLAGRRLGLARDPEGGGEGEQDLDQARLAIEAVRALLPLMPGDSAAPVKDALAQLQMAFARESQAAGAAAPTGASGESKEGKRDTQGEPPRSAQEEAERAKARSKIWTPPGA
jgi:hypothetical protein